jgi:hypothetical protein
MRKRAVIDVASVVVIRYMCCLLSWDRCRCSRLVCHECVKDAPRARTHYASPGVVCNLINDVVAETLQKLQSNRPEAAAPARLAHRARTSSPYLSTLTNPIPGTATRPATSAGRSSASAVNVASVKTQ